MTAVNSINPTGLPAKATVAYDAGEVPSVSRPASATETAPTGSGSLDRPYRSLVKAISWRVTGTMDTILVSLLVTGRIKLAISIGFVELFTKILLYYLHERIWNKITLGRTRQSEDYEI